MKHFFLCLLCIPVITTVYAGEILKNNLDNLYQAIYDRDDAATSVFAKKIGPFHLNNPGNSGRNEPFLHVAARVGDPSTIRLLLALGASPFIEYSPNEIKPDYKRPSQVARTHEIRLILEQAEQDSLFFDS